MFDSMQCAVTGSLQKRLGWEVVFHLADADQRYKQQAQGVNPAHHGMFAFEMDLTLMCQSGFKYCGTQAQCKGSGGLTLVDVNSLLNLREAPLSLVFYRVVSLGSLQKAAR